MESILHNVRDMKIDQKLWLEEQFGHRLHDEQVVMIRVLSPGAEPSEEARRQAMDDIQAMTARAHERAVREGITGEEADAAVEEAIEHIRRRPS